MLLDAVGLPREQFSPTFAVGRVAGWCAHVIEQRRTGRLIRPARELHRPDARAGRVTRVRSAAATRLGDPAAEPTATTAAAAAGRPSLAPVDVDRHHRPMAAAAANADYVPAEEALRLLGVKPATLYTYVSRGWVTRVRARGGRGSLYLRADLMRLKTRHDARAGHAAVGGERAALGRAGDRLRDHVRARRPSSSTAATRR